MPGHGSYHLFIYLFIVAYEIKACKPPSHSPLLKKKNHHCIQTRRPKYQYNATSVKVTVAGIRSSCTMKYIHTVARPGARIICPSEGEWRRVYMRNEPTMAEPNAIST